LTAADILVVLAGSRVYGHGSDKSDERFMAHLTTVPEYRRRRNALLVAWTRIAEHTVGLDEDSFRLRLDHLIRDVDPPSASAIREAIASGANWRWGVEEDQCAEAVVKAIGLPPIGAVPDREASNARLTGNLPMQAENSHS